MIGNWLSRPASTQRLVFWQRFGKAAPVQPAGTAPGLSYPSQTNTFVPGRETSFRSDAVSPEFRQALEELRQRQDEELLVMFALGIDA